MTRQRSGILITGATGLVGRHVLPRVLRSEPGMPVFVLVRDVARWRDLGCPMARSAHQIRACGGVSACRRVTPVEGDLTRPGLGLTAPARAALEASVGAIVHAAADTVFSRSLSEARRVNTEGTARVVELAERCRGLERIVHVSTAFVAGRLTGRVHERDNGAGKGFVNGYEQSKYEAESRIRASGLPWVIARPSSIVCDGPHGHVSQYNAVHRALRLYHNGLASMMPGEEPNPVDVVSADYVADGVTALLRAPGVEGGTFHLCSGDRAISLGRMLDMAYDVWSRSPAWRRRGISRPALTDLATYRLFERSVEETGDARLATITRSLSYFVPQLALPKRFDTTGFAGVTARPAPSVEEFWARMLQYLVTSEWAAEARRAA